jgi:hypothetical protein
MQFNALSGRSCKPPGAEAPFDYRVPGAFNRQGRAAQQSEPQIFTPKSGG